VNTVLHTESSLGLGGQEIRTLTEARWMVERGWRVIVAGQPGGRFYERAQRDGLEAVVVPMRSAWDARAVHALQRLIARERVGVVHTHSSIDGWLGGMAARLARVPVVRTRHVSIPIRRGWNPVYTWLADRVITSGEAIRRMVIGAGVPPDRVLAIPAGVNLDEFPFRRPAADAAEITAPVIGSVAMFRGSKGHAHLIEAFRTIHAERPTATLVLVGDGIRRTWVEGLAQQAGLGSAVVFTGFRADVPSLLAGMHCFVLASTRTEGVPQSLLQAFATGVPVVASDVGGIPEVVVDGETGVLVKSGSAAELARGIEVVLSAPEAAARRALAARRLIQERFAHDEAIGRLLAVYGELMAHRQATARAS
jgi:glycosyltransferase involved in cell wall biosynthesis